MTLLYIAYTVCTIISICYLNIIFTHWYVDVVLPEFCLDHICRIEAAGQVSVADVAAVVGEAWVQDEGVVVALCELANLYLEKSWQIVSWNHNNLVKRLSKFSTSIVYFLESNFCKRNEKIRDTRHEIKDSPTMSVAMQFCQLNIFFNPLQTCRKLKVILPCSFERVWWTKYGNPLQLFLVWMRVHTIPRAKTLVSITASRVLQKGFD